LQKVHQLYFDGLTIINVFELSSVLITHFTFKIQKCCYLPLATFLKKYSCIQHDPCCFCLFFAHALLYTTILYMQALKPFPGFAHQEIRLCVFTDVFCCFILKGTSWTCGILASWVLCLPSVRNIMLKEFL